MSFCAFSQERLAYGATCVDNLFFQEFLPRASGDAVRVYLYGLYCAARGGNSMTLEKLAQRLDMDLSHVQTAFQYWERQGLVLRKSDNPPTYEFQDVRTALSTPSAQEQYYGLRDFNNRLQSIFGAQRLLHPQDFSKAAEWVEDLKLPQDVVLAMVKSCVEKRKGVTFKYMDKIAVQWAKEGIQTLEQARRLLDRDTEKYRLAKQVLTYFNLNRAPTEAELDLSRKWLEEYALSPDDVIAACGETAAGTNPSFRYVDSVLSGRKGRDVSASIQQDNEKRAVVTRLLREMGLRTAPTPEHIAKYDNYLAAGFEPEAILETARSIAQSGRTGFHVLDATLSKCMEKGMFRLADIQAFRQQKAEAEKMMAQYGITRPLTDAECQMAQRWKQDFRDDLIQAAAQRAVGAKKPITYMNSILQGWKEKGIDTPQKAAEERPAPQGQTAHPEALSYPQRTYTQEQRKSLFVNLEDE